ncbi:MAG: hypothetical protein IJA60_02805 [Clostridia bacterium]|nr:hypothetical protein [Clostridia bacterium]
MMDFLILMLITAILLFFVLVGIEYASSKSKRTRIFLVYSIILAFSALNAWVITVNQNKIPIDSVEKAWNDYTKECREQHISWNELTFPEWLGFKAAE